MLVVDRKRDLDDGVEIFSESVCVCLARRRACLNTCNGETNASPRSTHVIANKSSKSRSKLSSLCSPISRILMSFSFHVPHGSAPPPELPIPNQDGIFEGPSHILSASANEAAVRAVNDALSGASEHARHPDPRSGLLESHIFPVIYTEYHFEDLKFGYLQ